MGVANGTVIGAGGTLELLSGATFSGITVESGGIVEAGSGYVLSGTSYSAGQIIEIAASGSAVSVTFQSGAQAIIWRAARRPRPPSIAVAARRSPRSAWISAARSAVQGRRSVFGTATFTDVSGGTQTVQNGGLVSGATIVSGGIQNVQNGGLVSGATIVDGGIQNVLSGGNDSGSTIGLDGNPESVRRHGHR